uniref:Tetratricopeptide repeat protein 5 OB fold domain-containing protein n=1 Tax=Ananas comosus var. bracteatus TaxID=296719 RepID=A0A6V7PV40_ANACO|nr:unnamed protein product [Ananas comosus var. bracteatus]
MQEQVRSKRLTSLLSSLAEVNLKSSPKKSAINVLSEGLNKAVAVVGKVLLFVKHDNIAPLYYLTCDLDKSCFILSVYGLHSGAIKEGDCVTLVDPFYRVMNFRGKARARSVLRGCGLLRECLWLFASFLLGLFGFRHIINANSI